ncbi:AAA family ATPase, partial [archaeon]|nr:AAA family ATPase [archaeon]
INHIKINDEYDDNEIYDKCKDINKLLLIGSAGCGKSYQANKILTKKFNKKDILCCTAWNFQAMRFKKEYNINSITLHQLLGLNIDDKQQKKEYDISNYKAVIFDEIYLFTLKQLMKIDNFMKKNSDKIFIATGDDKQLEAVGDLIDNEKKTEYLKLMYGNFCRFKINKRLQQKDRKIIDNIRRDLFYNNCSINDIMQKYFSKNILNKCEDIIDNNIVRGVSFKQTSRFTINKMLNSYVNKDNKSKSTKINGLTYFKGDKVICNKTYKIKSGKLYTQNIYTIKGFIDNKVKLEDELSNNIFLIDIDILNKNFSYKYIRTAHGSQSDSISEKYVIIDIDNNHIDKKWLYSVITRTRDIDNVYFLNFDLSHTNNVLQSQLMVMNYKRQDSRFDNIDMSKYIDHDWIIQEYTKNKICSGKVCGHQFMSFEKSNVNKISVDRIDNNLPHYKDNCQLLCKVCNSAKSKRQ